MSIQKKCTVCGKEFTAKNDKGTYCSNSCRVKAYRKREKEGNNISAKKIIEEYEEDILFFRSQLRDMYDEVSKMRSDVETMKKYMLVFTDKLAKVQSMNDTGSAERDIKNLSYKIDEGINKLRSNLDDRIDKNELNIDKNRSNIMTAGSKLNEIVYILNNPQNNSGGSTIDKLLGNENLVDIVDVFMKNVSGKKQKANEAS